MSGIDRITDKNVTGQQTKNWCRQMKVRTNTAAAGHFNLISTALDHMQPTSTLQCCVVTTIHWYVGLLWQLVTQAGVQEHSLHVSVAAGLVLYLVAQRCL
jgi:hypothetical protein